MKGPYMKGCPKGYRMHLQLDHPDRLLFPLARKGERGSLDFERISWDEALDTAARQLRSRDPETVIRLGGSGSCRGLVHNTGQLTKRFLSGLGSYTDTSGNFSSQTTGFMKPHLTGRRDIGIDARTLLDSKFIVLLGFNPRDTRFGCETEEVLREVKKRGIPCILIDPRRTASADLCGASWIPIRPGTDAVLLSALLYEVLTSGHADMQRIEGISRGFGEIASWVMGKHDGVVRDPEWAEPACGISAGVIRMLARKLESHHPAALLPGLSVQRTLGGEEADRMALVLQTALGNIGVSGGSAGCGQWNHGPGITVQGIPSKIPGAPVPKSVPVYQWPEAVGPGSCIYNVGGNYIGQGSDIQLSTRALKSADFIVTHEQFMTPTARCSDIILPVSMFLERRDLCTSNAGLLLYSEAAAAPAGEVKDDYEIFCSLASLLGFGNDFSEGRSADNWVDHILEQAPPGARNDCLEQGYWEIPERPWVGLSEFVSDPVSNPLPTPSGRLELNPKSYAALTGSTVPILAEPETGGNYPLALITPHARYYIHSQITDDSLPMDRKLVMHPDDAAQRGIGEGDHVLVLSPQGELTAEVRISEDIMNGVVSKLQGTWPVFDAASGALLPNDSVNMVSSTTPTMPSYGSRTHSTAVEVVKAC